MKQVFKVMIKVCCDLFFESRESKGDLVTLIQAERHRCGNVIDVVLEFVTATTLESLGMVPGCVACEAYDLVLRKKIIIIQCAARAVHVPKQQSDRQLSVGHICSHLSRLWERGERRNPTEISSVSKDLRLRHN